MSSGGKRRKLHEMHKEAERRRRSPRICALGDPKSLEHVSITCSLSSPNPKPKKQNGKQLPSQHHRTDYDVVLEKDSLKKNQEHDHQILVPYTTEMPEKRILELILDILQRRDTHEIFDEPVDPEKVEDYYKIIKEPMDFGTMRAKLHEGMYTSLQQFQHDVLLISRNAMAFNSPTTIYFKQAQAIQELANKVFDALKSDPENFESEFSETRRRTCRRDLGGNGNSRLKLPSNIGSRNLVIGVAAKAPSHSLRRPSNLRRRIQVNPGLSSTSTTTASLDAKEFPSGSGVDGKRCDFLEEDRRCTYKPWISEPSVPKQLIQVNGDYNYRESLMLFVKHLGPKVQMFAKRKLLGTSRQGQVEHEKCEVSSVSHPKVISRSGLDLNEEISMMEDDKVMNCVGVKSMEDSQLYGDGKASATSVSRNRKMVDLKECMLLGEASMPQPQPKPKPQPQPQASGFVFDLPFLKIRLEQINSQQ